MKLAIVSATKDLGFEDASEIAAAIEKQIGQDYAPTWQSGGCDVAAFQALGNVPADWMVMAVLRDADQAGDLGYHSVTPDGRPFARVFTGPVLVNGGTIMRGALSISAVLSHEAIEAFADPTVSCWYDVPADVDENEEEPAEPCDRVEDLSYQMDGVAVSNFLTPLAFSSVASGRFDFMGKLAHAWDRSSGGYCVRRRGGPGGATRMIGAETIGKGTHDRLAEHARHAARHGGQRGRVQSRMLGIRHP